MRIQIAAKALRKSLPRAKAPLTFPPQLQVTVDEKHTGAFVIPLTHVFVNRARNGHGDGRRKIRCCEISAYRLESGALVIEVRE